MKDCPLPLNLVEVEAIAGELHQRTKDALAKAISAALLRDVNFRRVREKIIAKMAADQLDGMGMTD